MDIEAKVQLLMDKMEITELMHAFGRGLDLHDWEAYASCFEDQFNVDFEELTGLQPARVDRGDWTDFARVCLASLKLHHVYSNGSISVSNDRASGVIYMISRQWRPDEGNTSWTTQYGWFENEFRKHGEAWKISRLSLKISHISGDPSVMPLDSPEAKQALSKLFGSC